MGIFCKNVKVFTVTVKFVLTKWYYYYYNNNNTIIIIVVICMCAVYVFVLFNFI